jgi:hypothetical protein
VEPWRDTSQTRIIASIDNLLNWDTFTNVGGKKQTRFEVHAIVIRHRRRRPDVSGG